MIKPKKYLFFILLIMVFLPTTVFSAQIYKVKGRKAIVQLQGLDVEMGDVLSIRSKNGRQKASVKVLRIKRTMALVQIVSGQVNAGDMAMLSTGEVDERSLATDITDVEESDNIEETDNFDESTEDDYEAESDEEVEDDYETEEADPLSRADLSDESEDDVSDIESTDSNEDVVSTPSPPSSSYPPPSPSKRLFAVGLVGEIALNAMHLTFSPTDPNIGSEDITNTGFGFGAKVAVDYDILDTLGLRAFAGWQQFNANSKDSRQSGTCSNQEGVIADCKMELDMLLIHAQLHYYFLSQSTDMFRPWFGLGGGLLIPLRTSENTALMEDPSTTGILTASMGGNINISSKLYFAPQLDFNYFLSSSTDAITYFISLKVGLMYSF